MMNVDEMIREKYKEYKKIRMLVIYRFERDNEYLERMETNGEDFIKIMHQSISTDQNRVTIFNLLISVDPWINLSKNYHGKLCLISSIISEERFSSST